MLSNTEYTFGTVTKFFHWIMAFFFIGLFVVAYVMQDLPAMEEKWMLYGLHKSTGILMFALAILRLTWRITQPQPRLPNDQPSWQKIVAKGNFIVLYLLMFGMPLTGLTMSLMGGHDVSFYNLFKIQAIAQKHPLGQIAWNAHRILSYILIAAVSTHIGAALYHHFIRKDNVLKSMLPFNETSSIHSKY